MPPRGFSLVDHDNHCELRPSSKYSDWLSISSPSVNHTPSPLKLLRPIFPDQPLRHLDCDQPTSAAVMSRVKLLCTTPIGPIPNHKPNSPSQTARRAFDPPHPSLGSPSTLHCAEHHAPACRRRTHVVPALAVWCVPRIRARLLPLSLNLPACCYADPRATEGPPGSLQ